MLTPKQSLLFKYLKKQIQETDICPSFEEMRIWMKVQSKSTIFAMICRLEDKNYIRRLKSRARAIEMLK